MARESICKALNTRLDTFVPLGGETIPIAWDAVGFTPPTGGPWIDQSDLIATPEIAGIGVTAPTKYIGTYVIRVYYPVGQGAVNATRQADALVQHFKRGTKVSADGLSVVLPRTWKGTKRQDSVYVFFAINVEYFAYEFP